MSLLCSHKDISGADLIRLMARAAERPLKTVLDAQEPEREKTSYLKEIIKGVLVLVVIYVAIMVIVGVTK